MLVTAFKTMDENGSTKIEKYTSTAGRFLLANVLPINYNIKPTIPHKGSAIFLHLTKNYKPTLGCIAISFQNF